MITKFSKSSVLINYLKCGGGFGTISTWKWSLNHCNLKLTKINLNAIVVFVYVVLAVLVATVFLVVVVLFKTVASEVPIGSRDKENGCCRRPGNEESRKVALGFAKEKK